GAGGRGALHGLGLLRVGEVAGEAFRVVEGRRALQLVVRVVTRDATDAAVAPSVAGAVEDSVSLKAQVVDTRLLRQEHGLVEADARLVKLPAVLNEVGLADLTLSETVCDGFGNRNRSVRDGVDTLIATADDSVCERAFAEFKTRV